TAPLRGSSFPIYPLEIAVNQILPSASAANPCGPDDGVLRGNSLNLPLTGSSRPNLLAACPVYQSDATGATAGSCGRDPGAGTSNSRIVTRGSAAIRIVTAQQTDTETRMDLRAAIWQLLHA